MAGTAPRNGSEPVKLGIANDYAIVMAGLARMLEGFEERVRVVDLPAGEPFAEDVDVVLYDSFGSPDSLGDLVELTSRVDRVIVFSWDLDPVKVDQVMAQGAAACLSKSVGAEELVAAVEAVCDGQVLLRASDPVVARPVHDAGLTSREVEVLSLVTQGLSNNEIAEHLYVSINSVKTYIRSAYRRIGAVRRSQAVRWGIEHNLQMPVPARTELPAPSLPRRTGIPLRP